MRNAAHHAQHSRAIHVKQIVLGVMPRKARMQTRTAAHDRGEIRAIAKRFEMRMVNLRSLSRPGTCHHHCCSRITHQRSRLRLFGVNAARSHIGAANEDVFITPAADEIRSHIHRCHKTQTSGVDRHGRDARSTQPQLPLNQHPRIGNRLLTRPRSIDNEIKLFGLQFRLAQCFTRRLCRHKRRSFIRHPTTFAHPIAPLHPTRRHTAHRFQFRTRHDPLR